MPNPIMKKRTAPIKYWYFVLQSKIVIAKAKNNGNIVIIRIEGVCFFLPSILETYENRKFSLKIVPNVVLKTPSQIYYLI